MTLHFHKYQGTGNDFILVDNRDGLVSLNTGQIANLCDRRFGIGADGLMLLEQAEGYDFRMVYFNSDGRESTMCGNGGRCIVAFAHSLGMLDRQATFLAVDGPHHATIGADGVVSLGMIDVHSIQTKVDGIVLDTGSPHFVFWSDNVAAVDVFAEGRAIRNRAEYQPGGINVNFVQRRQDGSLLVRTYERGVEDETLSCGTGVTAAAIASSGTALGDFEIHIDTPGGKLHVKFRKTAADAAAQVVLCGPAKAVFSGFVNM